MRAVKVMLLCGVYTAVDARGGAFGCDMNVRGHAALKQALQLHVEEAEDELEEMEGKSWILVTGFLVSLSSMTQKILLQWVS